MHNLWPIVQGIEQVSIYLSHSRQKVVQKNTKSLKTIPLNPAANLFIITTSFLYFSILIIFLIYDLSNKIIIL